MDICECYKSPPQGNFVVGNKYTWNYIIDGIVVKDENLMDIGFTEITWLWYFREEQCQQAEMRNINGRV